jgi:DoxX-like family
LYQQKGTAPAATNHQSEKIYIVKKDKIIFWVSTGLIFFFDSVIPALTSHTALAVEGVRHLGFPDYFRVQLTVFKVIGGVLLILPIVPARLKEWVYVGFGINFLSAAIAHGVVDGVNLQTFIPLIALVILIVSYAYFHRLRRYPRVALG